MRGGECQRGDLGIGERANNARRNPDDQHSRIEHFALGHQRPRADQAVRPDHRAVEDPRTHAYQRLVADGAAVEDRLMPDGDARADNTAILIGEETNVQDGAVGHSDPGAPLILGARVTIGHQAILHGCTIGDQALVGMGARILNGAVIGANCLVGAGALVTEGKRFDPGMLIVGVPARVVRPLTEAEIAALALSAAHYAQKAGHYARNLRLHA